MNALRQFQTNIRDRLTADPRTNPATILIEDSHDLTVKIEHAISKIGLVILVGNPSWEAIGDTDGRQTPDFLRVSLEVGISENPTLWRSKPNRPTCMDVADATARTLHGLEFEILFDPVKVLAVESVPDEARQIYAVRIQSQFLLPD